MAKEADRTIWTEGFGEEMGVGHRPRLKRNSFGGVELWVREFSETPCCDHKIDCDVNEAVKKLKQLLRNKEEREGDRGGQP